MLPSRTAAHRMLNPWRRPDEPFWRPYFHGLERESETELMRHAPYPVDMDEDENKIVVDAEMPGFQRDDINVDIQNGMVRISAERTQKEEQGRAHIRERQYSRVDRTIALPAEIDPDLSSASLSEGVLHIEMPKTGPESARRVEIS